MKAHHHFSDPEWDGEPIAPEGPEPRGPRQGAPEPRPGAADDAPEGDTPRLSHHEIDEIGDFSRCHQVVEI